MEITEIKAQLSIRKVLDYYGLKADRNGKMNCPFHDDKKPSFQIYHRSNTFCCFSSNCDAGTGDQIQFIELMEKKGKHQAILKAKEIIGASYSPISVANDTPTSMKNENAIDFETIFKKLKKNINSPKAAEYLNQRGLLPNDIGYNANAFEQLKNCIVFPLRDQQQNIVSLYGRSIYKGHYYTANRKGLFPRYLPEDTKTVILTESIIDAKTIMDIDLTNEKLQVLALYGTNGFSDEHLMNIKQLKQLNEIIFFFDGDDAGRKAANKYCKQLAKLNVKLTTVDTPEEEEINSLTRCALLID